MRIPEEKIEEIRNASNIVDIISSYVQLKKRGKNFVGLCPFHQEKTPSFTVSEEKQLFKCFGCDIGGNVFSFLMEYKNISFVEAVEEVAESLGIKINYQQQSYSDPSGLEELYEINTIVAKYFSSNLFNSDEGETARNYLKKRKIKTQVQRSFGLGYAFSEWEHFLQFAKDNNLNLSKAKQLGLIDTKDNGGFYDKFRGRIIFPIFSPNGRVIAFGGRILDPSAKTAKYLNSPESPIYLKRRSLYGLYHSKDEIRKLDKAVLVEGYMDLIALFQQGIRNVVASSGTSLTTEQVQLLSRYTKNIIVLFDADSAGQAAASRSIEILLKQNFEVKVVTLPDEHDPDSYINEFGKSEFENLLNNAKNFLEYQTEKFKKQGDLDDPQKETEAIRELVRIISFIEDPLKRNIYIKSISRKFGLREKLIESELEKFISQNRPRQSSSTQQKLKPQINGIKTDSKIRAAENKFEKEIITLLLEGIEEVMDIIFDHILPDEFINPVYKHVAELIFENYKKDVFSPSIIIEQIEDEQIKNFILSLSLNNETISTRYGDDFSSKEVTKRNLIKYADDIAMRYKVLKIDEQLEMNRKKIASGISEEEILELFKLNSELEKEKKTMLEEHNGK